MRRLEHESKQVGDVCRNCGKKILQKGQKGFCANCYDELLYKEVKEYILQNDATSVEVSEVFGLPLSKVNSWIKDGRIEYKNGWNPFNN